MRVSILIPTCNRVDYLRESLVSARSQTHRDIEILVSDDGSTDGTGDYVRSVGEMDPRVRLLMGNPSPGIFTNINFLVSGARGGAFCILADDDRIDPTFVSRLVEPLERRPEVVATFCDHRVIDATGRYLAGATQENSDAYARARLGPGILDDGISVVLCRSMCLGFSLYRASTFRDQPFDVTCGGAADWDYALRAARLGKLYYVPERLGDYRVHVGTSTRTRPLYMSRGAVRVLLKHRFSDETHERHRCRLLREQARIYAFDAAVVSRCEALRAILHFWRHGGSPLDPRCAVSIALTLMPVSLSRRVQAMVVRKASSIRARLRMIGDAP
jgi:glycosyltransferase involved in cell wall biosynthesis